MQYKLNYFTGVSRSIIKIIQFHLVPHINDKHFRVVKF
jgi:hypothetical protein